MPMDDHYGNVLSTASDPARLHFDAGVKTFLSGNFGAVEAFEAAIAADPRFALGHVGLTRALMTAGQMGDAKEAFARATALAADVTEREQSHINATTLILEGKAAAARAAVKAHVRDHPRDALVAQLCTSVFGLIGFSGEPGHEADLLAYTESLLPHYADDWWMMGAHAVSLCETGHVAQSEALMDRSLALNPRNANGAHFKSHAQYEAGETTRGRAYLTGWMEGYDDRAVLHGHLNWHLALWALHDGDQAEMWARIDGMIGPGASKGLPINTLTDTAAILHRASLAGISVAPERWKAVSDYAAEYFPNPGQSFADVHAALSHAMAGEGDRLARIAEARDGFADDVVRPLAVAFGQIARGNWAGALEDLAPVMAACERLGGSRAQRDLIELTYVNALVKTGHTDEARRVLLIRRPVLAASPPVAGLH